MQDRASEGERSSSSNSRERDTQAERRIERHTEKDTERETESDREGERHRRVLLMKEDRLMDVLWRHITQSKGRRRRRHMPIAVHRYLMKTTDKSFQHLESQPRDWIT